MISKWGFGVGVAAIGVLVALFSAAPASAADCNGGLRGGGPSAWQADGTDGELDEGVLFTDVGLDALRDDAVDGYGLPQVDGSDYENTSAAGCNYTRDGREILFPARTVSGVSVKPQLFVSKRKPTARQFVSLRNPSGSPVTIDFSWEGDLGSDSGTAVGTSTSGDISMNQGDRWGTSCEDDEADGCGNIDGDDVDRDPELAHNWEGRGVGAGSADLVFDPELNDGEVFFEFQDVTIGAGKTKTFMQLVSLAPSIRKASRAAKAIDRNPARAGAFDRLSKQERRRLVNW